MHENSEMLTKLAQKQFPDLTDGEKKLFSQVSQGYHVVYLRHPQEKVNPTDVVGPGRLIRASRIAWLCQDKQASALIGHRGIGIVGAHIVEDLDLSSSIIPFPFLMIKCVFADSIYFRNSEFRDLSFSDSYIPSINAQNMKVKGSLFLDGAEIQGSINLLGSTIDGDLECKGGTFVNKNGTTINAERAKITGNVGLCSNQTKQFRSEGTVNFNNAKIGGSVYCDDTILLSGKETAFYGQNMEIMGSLTMRGKFSAEGTVDLRGAFVGERFECFYGHFINKGGIALAAELMTIEGPVFWNDIDIIGEVKLAGTKIKGCFECERGNFLNEGGKAFFAQGVVIGDHASLRNIKASGEVNLYDARIGGYLNFDNSRLVNKEGKALWAEFLTVEKILSLRNIHADGEVNLLNSKIGNDVSFTKGHFFNKKGNAIMAQGVEIGGIAGLHSIEAAGVVSFADATIKGHFAWTKVATPKEITLDLRHARIGTIWDDEQSWPDKNHLWINELVYDHFDGRAPKNFNKRIKWLELQPDERFYPQPYEQIAKIFDKNGQEEDAKKILIAKGNDPLWMEQMTVWEKIWHKFLGVTTGYGYRPFRALGFMLIFLVVGWILFSVGHHKNLISPISDPHPEFSSIIYSVDTLVPVIDLSLKKFWIVKGGGWLRIYMIAHIFAGWVLTTLFLVGLSGLIKR